MGSECEAGAGSPAAGAAASEGGAASEGDGAAASPLAGAGAGAADVSSPESTSWAGCCCIACARVKPGLLVTVQMAACQARALTVSSEDEPLLEARGCAAGPRVAAGLPAGVCSRLLAEQTELLQDANAKTMPRASSFSDLLIICK
jgi:hypothetical protein